jgi:hypothetical protein
MEGGSNVSDKVEVQIAFSAETMEGGKKNGCDFTVILLLLFLYRIFLFNTVLVFVSRDYWFYWDWRRTPCSRSG